MANGLMGLSNLLGASSNTQSGGLMGGGVFSQPQSRSQRRARLLSDAIQGAQTSYGRSGAAIGGLLGMGLRAGAEGLGLIDAPPEVKRDQAIREVQQEVSQLGLDPVNNREEFGQAVIEGFTRRNQPQMALLTAAQIQRMRGEQPEVSNVREAQLESGETVLVGTLGNQAVRIGGQGPVPLNQPLASEDPSRTAREKKIDYYIEQGFDQRTANDLANGMIESVTDPVTGQSSLVNRTGGPVPNTLPAGYNPNQPSQSVVPEERQGQATPRRPGEPEPAQGQPDRPGILDQPIESVGLVPYLKEGVERTAGQFVDAANYPDVTRQRSNLRQTAQQLITSLSISGRPPVMEQERIDQMTASLGPFESPERARILMEEVAESALQQRQADLEAINNEELNPTLRKDLQARVNSTERMLRLLDPRSIETGALTSPKDLTPEQANSVVQTGIEEGTLPSNADIGAFDLENNGYPILQDGEPLLDPQGNPYYIFPEEGS